MTMLESVLEKIKKCEDSLSKISVDAQRYIEKHNEYIEGKILDSSFIKDKMKEKIAKVIDR